MSHLDTGQTVLPVKNHFIRDQIISLGNKGQGKLLSRDIHERRKGIQMALPFRQCYFRTIPCAVISDVNRVFYFRVSGAGIIKQKHSEVFYKTGILTTFTAATETGLYIQKSLAALFRPSSRFLTGICHGADGGWTAWPPHEHGREREETYVYFGMGNGFAAQFVYDDMDQPIVAALVRDGDVITIPHGYHPNVGCPCGGITYAYVMVSTTAEDRKFMDLRTQKIFGDKLE